MKKKIKQNLEELTEVDFERGIIRVLRELSAQRQNAINMMNDIDYYQSKGYKVYYYFNKKEKTYTYFAEEGKVGFQYENNKTQDKQSAQTKKE